MGNLTRSTNILSFFSIILLTLSVHVVAGESAKAKNAQNAKRPKGKDIFRPVADKLEANRGQKNPDYPGVIGNLFEWAYQFKNQMKGLLGIQRADSVESYRNQIDEKVILNIAESHVRIFRHMHNKVESRVKGRIRRDIGMDVKPKMILNDITKQAENNDQPKPNSIHRLLDNMHQLENAIKPVNQQKNRARKNDNLVLKKFGIGSEINLKSSTVSVRHAIPRRVTRNENRYANQDVDELFAPIKIVWEIGPIKKTLEALGKGQVYSLIKKLLAKATAILQSYVLIAKTEKELIEITEGKRCGFIFQNSLKFETHLLMLVKLFEPPSHDKAVIARSIYCSKTEDNRATIGVLNLNIKKLISPKSSITRKRDFLNTIVHETLHTLAFHSDGKNLFLSRAIKIKHKNLELIKRVNTQIYENGHWADEYLPNDLMSPYMKSDTILSIFTLELLEHQSERYAGQRKNLVANPFFSNIDNVEDFFNYNCIDSVKPKYDLYCSKNQVVNDHRLCSRNYVFQTSCERKRKNNNCFLKNVITAGNCMDPVLDPNFPLYHFEHRGSNSRCFLDAEEENSYCLKFEIANGKVIMILGKMALECSHSFQIHDVVYQASETKGYNLSLKCPDITAFVAEHAKTTCPDDCHNNGFCSAGKCICFNGFDSANNCRTLEKSVGDQLIFSEAITR